MKYISVVILILSLNCFAKTELECIESVRKGMKISRDEFAKGLIGCSIILGQGFRKYIDHPGRYNQQEIAAGITTYNICESSTAFYQMRIRKCIKGGSK